MSEHADGNYESILQTEESAAERLVTLFKQASEREWHIWRETFQQFKPKTVPRGRSKSHTDDPDLAFLSGHAVGYRLAMAEAIELINAHQTELGVCPNNAGTETSS